MKRTRTLIALLTALFVLVLTACSQSSSGGGGSDTGTGSGSGTGSGTASSNKIELSFYYPVQVGGPLTQVIEGMAKDFMAENPDIVIKPVFSGNYFDTLTKIQTLINGGQQPDMAILLATDVYTLVDQDFVIPLDDLIASDPDGQEYINDFYPAFMENSRIGSTTYGIPFQRSNLVMYWNKDLFRAAGLTEAPKNWDELVEYGKKITNAAEGIWGIKIASDTNPYWNTQGFSIQAGKNLMNDDGTEVYFNSPENLQAIEFYRSLAFEHQIMPTGTVSWASLPSDFISGKVGMIFHSSGSLTNIKNGAQFDYGVAFLPAGPKGYGTPTGGGNFYIFKGISEEKQKAAWKFIRFMTEPERMAQWSIETGYVAARQSAYETQVMKDFTAENPDYLVARDQMPYAQAELATHENPQIYKIYNDRLQAVITGAQTVEEAMNQAQQEAEALLAPYKH